MKRRKIFFDGGYRAGEMEVAVVTGGETFVLRGLGPGDRLQAEWLALLFAISVAHLLELEDFVLLGDALDVVDQASGRARIAPSCQWAATQLLEKSGGADLVIRHVKRTQNLAGIALARATSAEPEGLSVREKTGIRIE